MKKNIVFITCLLLTMASSHCQKVSISGTKFMLNNKEIWFNGVNTAWQKHSDWSLDYLDKDFDHNWWGNEMKRYKQNHINLARVWIHCTGNSSPKLEANGYTKAPTAKFFEDMDDLVEICSENNLFIMPTIWSFDMVKDDGRTKNFQKYRDIINDVEKSKSYINNWLIPFVKRYSDNTTVMGYDMCNEAEHIWSDANCGKLNYNNVIRFFAMCSAAIHKNCEQPVTIGCMWIIYNSNKYFSFNKHSRRNNWSNSSMQSRYNDPQAFLDFYSPHWYQWQFSGAPFTNRVENWLEEDDRPVIIGETPGYDVHKGSHMNNYNWVQTIADFYLNSYNNGYDGVCAWKNPHEDDNFGSFNELKNGPNAFFNSHSNLVQLNTGQAGKSDNIPPTSPQKLHTTEINAKSVTLSWEASRDNLGIAGYNVYSNAEKIGSTSATNYTVNELTELSSYKFTVKAIDLSGNLSSESNKISVKTPATPVNLALRKSVLTSSRESSSYSGKYAVDGKSTSRWASAESDAQWIYVDLAQTYQINRVVLNWEAAFGKEYKIQVSSNANNWTNIKTITNGNGGKDEITISNAIGRYVRVLGVKRGTSWGYSLWEFEVYGIPVSTLKGTSNNSLSYQEEKEPLLKELIELSVYPNPAKDYLMLQFTVPVNGKTNVDILDMNGNLVQSVRSEYMNSGSCKLRWNINNSLKPGIYLAKVIAGNKIALTKIIIR